MKRKRSALILLIGFIALWFWWSKLISLSLKDETFIENNPVQAHLSSRKQQTQPNPNSPTSATPSFFRVQTHSSQFITPLSGCHIAKWLYLHPMRRKESFPTNIDTPTRKEVERWRRLDCYEELPSKRVSEKLLELQDGDTVYLPFNRIRKFVQNSLPRLQHKIVILSGQWYLVPPVHSDFLRQLVDHPNVTSWFCQNVPVYAPDFLHHPKVHPWPYGLFDTPFRHEYKRRETFAKAVIQQQQQKEQKIHNFTLAYFDLVTNPEMRANIPVAEASTTPSLDEYYRLVASSRSIFAPNGDRPECYRHYEAIGLGTTPITQLDPWGYRHLAGSVVFNNSDWSVDKWKQHGGISGPPDRNMIYQDYWKRYVEKQVSPRTLLQWDDNWTEVLSFGTT